MDNAQKAKVLVDALPYIKKYYDKTIVIKYGGNAMTSEHLKEAVMRDVVLLQSVGVKVVLVHGGGPEINETLDKMNMRSAFVNGLRYTDKDTAEVVRMVLAGKVNKSLVSRINSLDGSAIGLCGIDGNMLEVSKKTEDGVDYGYVGEIQKVNAKAIVNCLSDGYIPVIATIAADREGNVSPGQERTAEQIRHRRRAHSGGTQSGKPHYADGYRGTAQKQRRPRHADTESVCQRRALSQKAGHNIRRHDSQNRRLR